MFSILHLSDLHRSPNDHIGNDALLSSILADCSQFSGADPPIRVADAILVSGDLVQGLPLDSVDYPLALQAQYEEALDLLERLANNLLGGDRSRLVMVPGNHDVDWNQSFVAMEKVVDLASGDLVRELSKSESDYRWCWKTRGVFRITDRLKYDDRMAYYRNAFTRFYKNVSVELPVDSARSWNNYLFDNGRILITAFDSCHNNDCFRLSGDIADDAFHGSHLATLKEPMDPKLKIAMWHHNLDGPPLYSDYMDVHHIKTLIDRGYRLGLHGHQHKPDAQRHNLFLSGLQTMSVVSAGSLCAGSRDLPHGFVRQYNVIEINDDFMRARVHVREMRYHSVFCAGRIPSVSDRSFVDVSWTRAPRDISVNTALGGGAATVSADRIEGLVRSEELEEAEAETVKS